MGLDAVELVLDLEEKFGIEIPDKDAEVLFTVGDMRRYIYSKLTVVGESTCLSQHAFHLVRRYATEHLGIARRSIRPDTPLSNIFPAERRRESLLAYQSHFGLSAMPDLTRPSLISAALTAPVLVVLVATFWGWALAGSPAIFLLVGVPAAIFVGWLGARLTRGYKTEFPEGATHVRDLARHIVANCPKLLGRDRQKSWTEEEVNTLLSDIIIEHTGVTDFNNNSRFVADLHLD